MNETQGVILADATGIFWKRLDMSRRHYWCYLILPLVMVRSSSGVITTCLEDLLFLLGVEVKSKKAYITSSMADSFCTLL